MKKRKRPYLESRPKRKETVAPLEVTIERILPGGAGLAHAEGLTILVGLAAPGDRLRVKIERSRGAVAFASILEIIEASPVRVSPPCPYFGRCGGCDFQQLDYKAQLSAKVEIIRDCLRRIARIDFPREIPITPSPDAWRYRSRAQWQFDARQKRFGYFERGTHNICDVASCPVLTPTLEEKLEELRERVRQGDMPREAGEFQAVAGDEGASVFPPFDEEEAREVTRRIGDHLYRFSADGFFQINQDLLPALIDAAIGEAQGENALDLYCGAGLFTLPLSKRFARVTGVEAHPGAVASGRRNLEDAGASNAHIECSTVGEWLHEHAASLAPSDFILLDPPRSGTEDGVIAGILAARPKNISYVSCDPATLARDLLVLQTGGYQLDSLAAFDMFPQTHHVETVAHLNSLLTANNGQSRICA